MKGNDLPAQVLVILKRNSTRAVPASELAEELQSTERGVRTAITQLRRAGFNVRDDFGAGFWLSDEPAPPLAPQWVHDGRWRGKPPKE